MSAFFGMSIDPSRRHFLTFLAGSPLLAAAGLDVFRMEPVPEFNPLLQLPNVVLSPHMAGGSSERYWKVDVAGVLENIRRHIAGEGADGLLQD